MATWFDDCSALTDWSERGIGSGTDFAAASGVITKSTNSVEVLQYDPGSTANDWELLIKAKVASLSGTHYLGVIRGSDSGSASTANGYVVALRLNGLRVYSNVSGTHTQIGSNSTTYSSDTYYRFRLRANGTAIKCRIWLDGDSEPGTWDVDTTNSDHSSGYAGLRGYLSATTATWDFAGFGTAGDTAPSSAGSGTTISPGAGSITLTGYAPTAFRQFFASPGKRDITLTGYAPTVSVQSGSYTFTPGKADITLTGYAPTAYQAYLATPGKADITLTGYAPSLRITQLIEVGKADIVLTGYAPTLQRTYVVTPGAGAVTLTGYAPTLGIGTGTVTLAPGVGYVYLTGYAPSISIGDRWTDVSAASNTWADASGSSPTWNNVSAVGGTWTNV